MGCINNQLYLYIWTTKGIYKNPTETIDVHKIKTVKTDKTRNWICFVSNDNYLYNLKILES